MERDRNDTELRSFSWYDASARKIIEYLPDATFAVDGVTKRIVVCNGVAASLFGYDIDELAGRRLSLLFAEKTAFLAFTKWISRLNADHDESGLALFSMNKQDGTVFLGEIAVRFLADEKSGKILWLGTIRDTGRTKGQGTAPSEDGAHYRDAVRLLPQAVYEYNRKGKVYFANEYGLNAFGYTRDDLEAGLNIFQAIAPEDHKKAREGLRRLFAGERINGREYMCVRKDGSRFPVNSFSAPITVGDTIVGLLTVLVDITEQKLVQKESEYLKRHIGRAQDIAGFGFWYVDIESRGIWASKGTYQMYGLEEAEFVLSLENIGDFVHPSDRERWNELLSDIMVGSTPPEVEYRINRHDGVEAILRASVTATERDKTGKPLRVYGLIRDVTKLKQAENALRMSEERFSKAFLCSPLALAITTEDDGRFVEVNETFELFTGYDRAEIAGVTIRESGLMADSCDGESTFDTVRATGTLRSVECRFRTKMNSEAVGLLSAELMEVGGEPHILWVIVDITARKIAERALAESEERYRFLFNGVKDAIFMHTTYPDGGIGRFVEVNDVACERLGYTREELLNMSPVDIDAHVVELTRAMAKSLRETGYALWESAYITKDGRQIPIEVSNHLLSLEGEEMVLAVVRDITDRKKAEQAVLESEAKYRTVVEHSLAGVYIYQDDRLRYANRRFCEIFGYEMEEIVDSKDPIDITHPEDRGMAREYAGRCLAGEGSFSVSHRAVKKDGTVIVISIFGSLMIYNGQPAVSGSVYDITDQEKVQEELRHKTALLEAQLNTSLDGVIVVDRGRKILQNQQANKLLKIPKEIAENDDDELQIEWVKRLIKSPDEFHRRVKQVFADPDLTARDEMEFKDGTILDRYTSPVIDKDGTRYGRIWTFRDITQSRRSEKALRISQIQLAEAIDLARMAYFEFDTRTKTHIFNDHLYALYGTTVEREGGYEMSEEEFLKRFFYPDDIPFYRRAAERNISDERTEGAIRIEHRVIRRDGEVRHLITHSKGFRDQAGQLIKVYGVSQDVTERIRAEMAIRESEARFRRLFETSPIGMVMLGLDLRINRANESFCRMSGYTEQELAGLTLKDMLHPGYIAQGLYDDSLARIKELLDGTIPQYRTERCYSRKDGVVAWGLSTMSVMRDRDGNFLCFFSMVEDITQRKQTEEELKKREEELKVKSSRLEEANTALTVLLRHRDEEKIALEETIAANISELVIPYAEKLRTSHLNGSQMAYLDILSTNLQNIVSPFLREVARGYTRLTPMEIQIADLIRNGKTSKEIAELLHVSKRTIDTHRENIREKLDLLNKGLNLQSYLKTLP